MVDKIWYNMEELIGGSEERGINRNILECKGVNSANASRYAANVLIETYWNVKCGQCIGCRLDYSVLIETYWNVKKDVVDAMQKTRQY